MVAPALRSMLLLPLLLAGAARASLQNGAGWLDTDGNQIEAHGGNILKIDGVYHWFGATKKELEYKGKPCVAECSLGVNLYTSSDLMTWKFAAMVFNHTQIDVPVAGVPGGQAPVLPLRIERPKVIFNAATKMYVLAFHCEDAPYGVGLRGVASSATPTGPFAWSHAENPNGLFSMDMTEYVDPNDPSGQAYHIRTARHNPARWKGENTQWTVGSKLSKDYLSTVPGDVCFNASVSAEGPAMLYHDGAYFIFASHLSGLAPNPARMLRCKAKMLSDCCAPPLGAPPPPPPPPPLLLLMSRAWGARRAVEMGGPWQPRGGCRPRVRAPP